MNDDTVHESETQAKGMTLGDIYFVLFRQKWIIILFSAVGVLGAAVLLAVNPLQYQSTTKLLIRYVVTGKSLNPPGNEQNARPIGDQEKSILNSEMEILTSFDLARQVAEAVGPERMLAKAGGGTNLDPAAVLVLRNLVVEMPANGSVILITFRHPDPEIAREALSKVIAAYYKKHAEAHQPVEMFGDFVTQEIERLRNQLARTDTELKAAKNEAGVTSVEGGKIAYIEQISKVREGLFSAQAEMAGHQAALAEATNVIAGSLETTNVNTEMETPLEQIKEYKEVCERLAAHSKRKQELLIGGLKESSSLVQEVREQIAETGNLKKQLETQYTGLTKMFIPSPASAGVRSGSSLDLAVEAVQVRVLKSKMEVLKSQLAQLQSEAAKLDEMEGTIQELQRKKELQEADLKYFSASLEQTRIDKAAGTGNAPNIGIIEPPTPSAKKWPKAFKKKVAMVAAGCAMSGVALAFLIEFVLNRSVKRPADVETKLRLPLFISIPKLSRNGNHRLAKANGKNPLLLTVAKSDATDAGSSGEAGAMLVPTRNRSHPMQRYCEGLRDRLIVNFEVTNVTQKPKLVGVTSCGKGVGVTTIAAGLAASLSETGNGNVLLVDMNAEQGASQEFYKGEPGCKLDDTLTTETMKSALVQTGTSVATDSLGDDKLPGVLPPRFANLMPKLKASHYDYIVFDMPPVSQTSLTLRLARIMDKVLLVIESEKTNLDVVKQATALLAEAKVNVSAVLNKTRKHVPARLHQDLNDV